MSDIMEVVLVHGKDGPVRVNKSDFDADQGEGGNREYRAYTDGPPLAAPPAPPDGRYVIKEKDRYFIVNGRGEKVTDQPLIDPKGYKTEDDAQKVIKDLPH